MRTPIFLSLVVLSFASTAHAQTVVTFSFDDTFDDQAQAASIFAAAGVHGTFYVNSARLGQSGFLTLDQVVAMQAAGNEIGGHTVDHLSLGIVPLEEEQRQICDDRAALLGMGLQVTSLAYPHGSAPTATQAIVSGCGYGSARDSSGLRSHDPEGCTNCAYTETMPPANAMSLRTPASIKSYMTLADLQQNVTDAEAHGGGWVPFVMHHVCDGCNTDAISPALLQQLVTWVAARQAMGTTVRTVHDVIGGAVGAAVTGPAPVAFVAADGNLLRDGDLETHTNTEDLPDCLEVLTGGADSADYTVGPAPAAHSGVSASQIAFSPGKSGTPRLASLQDLGYCSPPATPGQQFAFSFYYQASDPVAPVAYYRIASGWWKTLATGPTLPAAAAWTASTWMLPPAPAGTTAISVGVTILTTGTLAVDDFMLVDTASASTSDGGTVASGDGGVLPDGATSSQADAGALAPDAGSTWADGEAPGEAGPTPGGCALAPGRAADGALLALLALVALLAVVADRPRWWRLLSSPRPRA